MPDGLTLEVNCVDKGLPTAFWYAEVEYKTEAQALAWDPAAVGLGDYQRRVHWQARQQHGRLLAADPAGRLSLIFVKSCRPALQTVTKRIQ